MRLLWLILILLLGLPGLARAQTPVYGGLISGGGSGTNNQVACFDGTGTTIADCDCTFTMNGTNIVWQCGTDSTTGLQFLDQDGGTPIFNIDTILERVCIGCAAPSAPLHVVTAGTTIAVLERSGATLSITESSSTISMETAAAEDLQLLTSNAAAHIRINPSLGASVGIGPLQTTPVGTLEVIDERPATGDTLDIVRAGAGETGNLTEWQDNSSAVLASVDDEGKISATPGGDVPDCELYTVAFTDLTTASTTEAKVLFNLSARGVITGLKVKHSVAFTGTGPLTAMTVSVGDTVGPVVTAYTATFDIFIAPTNILDQDTPFFGSSTFVADDVRANFVATGGNMDDLTAGSVDFMVCWAVLP